MESPGGLQVLRSHDDAQAAEYFLGVTYLKPEVGDTPG